MQINGRVFRFGDNIDTDQIYPGRYLELTAHQQIGEHAMEGVDPDFVKKVKTGDIIVAGSNFGCGSSREHAVICLKEAGVSAIIAASFARIFFRNAINMGLPVIEARLEVEDEEKLTINLEKGQILKENGQEYAFHPLPANLLQIVKAGGVINYYKKQGREGDDRGA